MEGEINEKDFLDRADILCSLGYTVMISNYKKYYKLVEYLSQFTRARMGLIIGVDNLLEMFDDGMRLQLVDETENEKFYRYVLEHDENNSFALEKLGEEAQAASVKPACPQYPIFLIQHIHCVEFCLRKLSLNQS